MWNAASTNHVDVGIKSRKGDWALCKAGSGGGADADSDDSRIGTRNGALP